MDGEVVKALANNAALLLALSIIYQASYSLPKSWKKFLPAASGVLIGLIGIAVMSVPFQIAHGIFFDTRSILIGVTALTFGFVPTVIAAAITAIYRIIQGGPGIYMGLAVIVECAVIGLLWRRMVARVAPRHRWLNIYLFGVTIHIVMLLCTALLPRESAQSTLRLILLPVLLIYPIGTVLLSLLLFSQKDKEDAVAKRSEVEERYRSLYENSHAVMLLIDPANGAILDVNPAATRFYGWTAEQMRGMSIGSIVTVSKSEFLSEMQRALEEEQNHFVFKQKNAAGELLDVEVYSSAIRVRGRELVYSIVHDISERARATEELVDSEQRFRSLVENAPEAIFIETDSKFVYLNSGAVRIFGAGTEADLLGRSVLELFPAAHHEAVKERIRKISKEKAFFPPHDEVFLRLDGTPVDVDLTSMPTHYNGADSALVFARDISERKRLEAVRLGMEAQLRQQQKLEAIGTLAGGVAHEINNPITGIMNYAQLIADSAQDGSSEAEFAGSIITEAGRVAVIVKNLLQFSRQEKQSHSYASIYDIVNQTVSLIRTIIKKDQIELDIDMDESLPDIKCRSQQIQQVLMNLLTNARDALNEKFPDYHPDKQIRLTCSQYESIGRRWLKLTVRDNGNGVPADLKDKIYEPFFSTKPKELGTGLGLSISFGIVKDHHGQLTFESEEGRYTNFILDLPVDNGWTI